MDSIVLHFNHARATTNAHRYEVVKVDDRVPYMKTFYYSKSAFIQMDEEGNPVEVDGKVVYSDPPKQVKITIEAVS
jgi:hypothetical protein